jgi:4-amino-4-deoxy-L-arabinose transferase-like glycosyltransferase
VKGPWLGALAAVLAYPGTSMLKDETSRMRGAALLLAAGILAVVAWGRQRQLPVFAESRARTPRSRASLALASALLVTVLLDWQAVVQFFLHPEQVFGRSGWLWAASIALLIAATALWPAPAEDATVPPDGRFRNSRAELFVFFGLVVLAFAVRLWKLQTIPFAFDRDEFLAGRVATETYLGAAPVSIFKTAPLMADLPNLWFLLLASSLKAFGVHLWALRLPAALFGGATVIPFYGFVRAAWGRTAAIAGSAVLAASPCNLHYSRITINNIVTPFFWMACFFFLLRGLRRRRPVDWALAGLAGGLSEYFFYGTRLLPFVLAGFLAYLLVVHGGLARRELPGFLLLALGYVIGFGPLLAQHLSHRGLYLGRGLSVLTWDHIPRGPADLSRAAATLWPAVRDNLLGFSALGDTGPFYIDPLLLPAEAALLALGVALLLRRWRHPPSFLLLLSGFGVVLVVGTLLPGVRRIRDWTPAFPVFFAALAVPVEAWARSASEQFSRPLRLAAAIALGLGLFALTAFDLDFYFHRYRLTRPFAELEIRAMQSRWQASLGSGYRVRTIGATWQPYDPNVNKYLVADQDGGHLANPAAELPLPGVEGKGLGFLFLKESQQDYYTLVRSLYPGGTEGLLKTAADGYTLFSTYVVAPEQAAARYGVRLELLGKGGNILWNGRVEAVGALPPGTGGAADASRARWSGELYVSEFGGYEFDLGTRGAVLRLDALTSIPAETVLQAGWHPFVVESSLAAAGAPRLRVKKSGGPSLEIPRGNLWPWPPFTGLLRADAGPPQAPLLRVDPFIGFTALDRVLTAPGPTNSPARARWSGQLQAPRAGLYSLEVRTDGETRVSIGGRLLLAHCSTRETESAAASVFLQVGWHAFELDHRASPGTSTLELLWTPPGAVQTFIPPEALRYATKEAIDRLARPVPPPAGAALTGCVGPNLR